MYRVPATKRKILTLAEDFLFDSNSEGDVIKLSEAKARCKSGSCLPAEMIYPQ